MKTMSKVIQIFTSIIAILVVVMFILPIAVGIRPFIVLSGSMEPDIKTGSIVYINTNISSYEIVKDDIIGFRLNNQTVTHRVVEVNKEDQSFITKGDANDERDAVPVTFTNYLGKTIFTIPFIGKIIMFFKSGIGLYLLVALILLNVLLVILEKDKDNTYEKQE
jgi:signal peptidase